jgi:hypothetical protein
VSVSLRPSPPTEAKWGPQKYRSPRSIGWFLRHLVTIALAHALVLLTAYFLLLLGDALFSGYAIVLRDALFVSYVTRFGWLQQMAAEFKAGIAVAVAVSAVLQMLFFVWRARRP